jgi:hypothetical protein
VRGFLGRLLVYPVPPTRLDYSGVAGNIGSASECGKLHKCKFCRGQTAKDFLRQNESPDERPRFNQPTHSA